LERGGMALTKGLLKKKFRRKKARPRNNEKSRYFIKGSRVDEEGVRVITN